jgi:hypothetical protein
MTMPEQAGQGKSRPRGNAICSRLELQNMRLACIDFIGLFGRRDILKNKRKPLFIKRNAGDS